MIFRTLLLYLRSYALTKRLRLQVGRLRDDYPRVFLNICGLFPMMYKHFGVQSLYASYWYMIKIENHQSISSFFFQIITCDLWIYSNELSSVVIHTCGIPRVFINMYYVHFKYNYVVKSNMLYFTCTSICLYCSSEAHCIHTHVLISYLYTRTCIKLLLWYGQTSIILL